VQIWYETVRFHEEMHCQKCRQRLARRAAVSPVLDASGHRIESSDSDWGGDDRADFMTRCECGHEIEFKSPEDVEQLKSPGDGPTSGPPVFRLT